MKTVEESVTANVPVDVAYATWANYTIFPSITGHVVLAERITDRLSHWIIEVMGYRFDFEALLDQLKPNKFISWHSVTNIHHLGSVSFKPDAGRTLITLRITFDTEDLATDLADDLDILWPEFKKIFKEVLNSFKLYVEQMWWQVPSVV